MDAKIMTVFYILKMFNKNISGKPMLYLSLIYSNISVLSILCLIFKISIPFY